MLLAEGPARVTAADFDRAAPHLATHPLDPAKRDQIILPDGVSREMTAGATVDVREDDPTTLELIGQCAAEHYGFNVVLGGLGGTMAILGAPLLSKDGKILGKASRRTSIASVTARELFPKKLPRPMLAPTLAAPSAKAFTYGAFIGRWIPWVGWALLVADIAIISFCVSTAKNRRNID